jgi:thioredoxin reductase (NADPH)
MSGVEFLMGARELYPDTKRVLLTAYADTETAINAINTASAHYYLLKPWDPPEEKLYPVLDDLLHDWLAGYRPPFDGIQVVDFQWSPGAHIIKDFLARNQIPYQFLDLEREPEEAHQLLNRYEANIPPSLPLVIFPNGDALHSPTASDVAEKIGLQRQPAKQFYDLVIVGSGPGGLAAAVYGASEGLSTVMIERHAPGGQAGTSSRIENYLGFPSGLSGDDLARRATVQARRFGVEILTPQEAVGIRLNGPYRIVELGDGSEIACHVVVIAVGLAYRLLDAPGVKHLTGSGVYYGAALSEVNACSGQPVFIVGAGNSAGQSALHLVEFASRVVMVVRSSSLEAKMSRYLVDRLLAHPRIEVYFESTVTAVHGAEQIAAVTIYDGRTDTEDIYPAMGLFIFIGAVPYTQWLQGIIELDENGFVLTGPDLMRGGQPPAAYLSLNRAPFLFESSVPGIFAVGDVRANSVKRVASAVGEGSVAVQFIHHYLSRVK